MTQHLKKSAVIVGGGVIGLTTGITLLQNGWTVKIIAREVSPNTTSDKAAAFWLPFWTPEAGENFIDICQNTYDEMLKYYAVPESGIRKVSLHYLIPKGKKIEKPFWTKVVRNVKEVADHPRLKGFSAYTFDTHLMESGITMKYFMSMYFKLGGTLVQGDVASLPSLCATENADVVINCAGIAARELANDQDVHPVRGQIVLVTIPEGFDCNTVILDEETPNELAYIVPRKDHILLGGTTQLKNGSHDCSKFDVDEVLRKCYALEPALKKAKIIKTYAGLRPYRESGIRVERDTKTVKPSEILIHNYGHGGSGWSLSFGSALEVLKIAETALETKRKTVISKL